MGALFNNRGNRSSSSIFIIGMTAANADALAGAAEDADAACTRHPRDSL